jgi:hypothetical protein
MKGYALNEKRLKEFQSNLRQLEQAVSLIQQSGSLEELKLNEVKGLLEIISNYTRSFVLLNQFDSQRLEISSLSKNITYEIKFKEAASAIEKLN